MGADSLVLTVEHSQDLADKLWNPTAWNDLKKLGCGLDAFSNFYYRRWHLIAGHDAGQHVALRDPKVFNTFVHQLSAGGDKTRDEMLRDLKRLAGDNKTAEAYTNTLNLALGLLLMLKFGAIKGEAGPKRYLQWKDGSLRDFLEAYFEHPSTLSCDRDRLPKSFNAWSLEEIGGIQIQFTDNLADHLLLVEDDTKVLIFHHATFLQCHESMIPDEIVEETLATLALLFPQAEFGTFGRAKGAKAKWFQRVNKGDNSYTVDSRLAMCGSLQAADRQMNRFNFWRDRLLILKEAYDEATPRVLSQWWRDRRNGVQWYTFWVAILVFIVTITLGTIQCILAGLQLSKPKD